MKTLLMTLFVSSLVWAQDVGVKVDNINTDSAAETTISVTKGAAKSITKKYLVSEGSEDIEGEEDVLVKNARINWKTQCNDWKKEFKELNKDNKIISMSCGKMKCSKEGVEHKCTSVAKYKVRVLAEE